MATSEPAVVATCAPEPKQIAFQDILPHYNCDKDIFVAYKLQRLFTAHAEDWVGMFPGDWTVVGDCVAKQSVPKPTRRNKKIKQKGVLFPANSINVTGDIAKAYQFVYFTKDKNIAGLSSYFTLHDVTDMEDDVTDMEEEKAHSWDFTMSGTKEDVVEDHTTLSTDLIMSATDPTLVGYYREQPIMFPACPQVTADFTVTPSGTAILNELELLMDPELKSYLENQERALLPFHPEVNVLQSVCQLWPETCPEYQCAPDPSKENSWLESLANILSCSPSPHTPLFSEQSTSPSRPEERHHSNCYMCKIKQREIRTTKTKARKHRREKIQLNKELQEMAKVMCSKESMIDELSNQIKELVHEKTNLCIMSVEHHQQVTSLSTECDALKARVEEMHQTISSNDQKCQALEEELFLTEEEKSNIQLVLAMTETERHIKAQENVFLEEELSVMKNKYEAAESSLDDIMYTLSILGYTKMVDINGNETDLTQKKGSCMELHGWSMSVNKREEMNMKCIANKEEEIVSLKNDCHNMKEELDTGEQELEHAVFIINELQEVNFYLTTKMNDMADDLFLAADREAALYQCLVNEYNKQFSSFGSSNNGKDCSETSPTQIQDMGTNTSPSIMFDKPHTQDNKKQFSSDTSVFSRFCRLASQQQLSEKAEKQSTVADQCVGPSDSGYFHQQCSDALKDTEVTTDTKTPVQGMESSILQGNILGKLFKEGEPTTELTPKISSILQGKVLANLFREPKCEVTVTGSAVFKNNVLNNLFKQNQSEVSISSKDSFAQMPTPQGSACFLELLKSKSPAVKNMKSFSPAGTETLPGENQKCDSNLNFLGGDELQCLFSECFLCKSSHTPNEAAPSIAQDTLEECLFSECFLCKTSHTPNKAAPSIAQDTIEETEPSNSGASGWSQSNKAKPKPRTFGYSTKSCKNKYKNKKSNQNKSSGNSHQK